MAIVTESFSIREYTERMREIDFGRCWPFDEASEARPPILVRRFRWWVDELESSRSTAVVDEAKDTAISEGDETLPRLRTATRSAHKGKQKMPKKRSIVELFASSPLIAGVVDADEDNCDEREVEEMKESVIKKKKRGRKKKNNGTKDGLKVEICVWEKEKIGKPKMISSAQGYMFRNAVCNRKSRKTARSFVEPQKQPSMEKAVRKKHKALRTSILLSRNQEVPKKVPVRSILKNQKRGTTDRKSSKSVGSNAADLIKFYCKSNRHVTFSVEDDDIVRNSKASSSMNFPQLQNLCKIFSDVLAASSAMNNSSKDHDLPDANQKPQEVNSCEKGIHSSIISTIEASSTDKNQSSDSIVNLSQPTIINSSNSSCSGTEKASFAVMVDLNHAVDADDIDCNIPTTSTLSTSCIYSGYPNSRITSLEKNPNSSFDIHLDGQLSMLSETSLVPPPNGKFASTSDMGSSVTFHKNPCSHGSASCPTVYNNIIERQQPQTDVDANFCCQIKDHPSGGFQSSKGMLGSMSYSMGSKKLGESLFTTNSASTNRSKCAGKDFIGLPLNSQGELIQFHSGTKFSEAYNKKNMEWSSIQGFPANRHVESSNSRMNHLEIRRKKVANAASCHKTKSAWNQKQCYSTRERVTHWLKFAELEDFEKLKTQRHGSTKGKDIFPNCNSNPRSHSFPEYRNGDAIHDFCDRVDLQGKCNIHYHSQPAIQPTMRLMGKNVVFGEMNKEYNSFNDGKPWNHNEHLSQQWMQRECVSHPKIDRSKRNPLEMLDSTQNFYRMKASEPTLDSTNINRLPQLPSRCTNLAMVNHSLKLDMNKQGLHPNTFMTKSNQCFRNHMLGEGSISTRNLYPNIIASNPKNFPQHMLLSDSLCKPRQRVPTSQSQFKHQNFKKFPHPPLLQQPATNLPQWLLHAKHQKRTQLSDPHYSDPNVTNQPSTLSGTNSNFHLSSYHLPMIPLSSRSCDANLRKACRPFVSNTLSPTFIPHAPLPKSSADANKRSISAKKKDKEGENSKNASFEDPTDAHKLSKRPADFDDGMVSSSKRPLKGQLSSNISEVKGTNQTNEHLDQAISMEFHPTENENGSCRSISCSNSLKFGGELRSGPTKLIAGAKHILKPCQREDEDNCRPIHSTIMLHNTDASGKSFGPEKSISNIYNF